MTNRRDVLALGSLGGTALFAQLRPGLAAGDCPPAGKSEAVINTRRR